MKNKNIIWTNKETAKIASAYNDLFVDVANQQLHNDEHGLAGLFKGRVLDVVLGDNEEDGVAYEILESYLNNVDWTGIASVYYAPIDGE